MTQSRLFQIFAHVFADFSNWGDNSWALPIPCRAQKAPTLPLYAVQFPIHAAARQLLQIHQLILIKLKLWLVVGEEEGFTCASSHARLLSMRALALDLVLVLHPFRHWIPNWFLDLFFQWNGGCNYHSIIIVCLIGGSRSSTFSSVDMRILHCKMYITHLIWKCRGRSIRQPHNV